MEIAELRVPDAYVMTPTVHGDDRGSFHEWFRADTFAAATGHRFELAQANASVSSAGAVRGVHFAELPPGQAKWVTCLSGAVLDVVLDIRVGSPTFGEWAAVELDTAARRAVYLSEGLGHAFMALTDGAVVSYLCSAPYAPGREHGVQPFDAAVGIAWPETGPDGRPLTPRLSPRDAAAPSLTEAADQGLLPSYDDARAGLDDRRRRG